MHRSPAGGSAHQKGQNLTGILLYDTRVTPNKCIKVLGVEIDHHLSFKIHAVTALRSLRIDLENHEKERRVTGHLPPPRHLHDHLRHDVGLRDMMGWRCTHSVRDKPDLQLPCKTHHRPLQMDTTAVPVTRSRTPIPRASTHPSFQEIRHQDPPQQRRPHLPTDPTSGAQKSSTAATEGDRASPHREPPSRNYWTQLPP